MIEGMAHQFISLPAGARDRVVPALERAGISVEPATGRRVRQYRGMADVYLCQAGQALAEIALMRTDSVPAELAELTAVVRAFLDPVLDGAASGRWSPAKWVWALERPGR